MRIARNGQSHRFSLWENTRTAPRKHKKYSSLRGLKKISGLLDYWVEKSFVPSQNDTFVPEHFPASGNTNRMVIQREYSTNPWWDLWPQSPHYMGADSHGFFDDPFARFLGRRSRIPLSCAAEMRARQSDHYGDIENNGLFSNRHENTNPEEQSPESTSGGWGDSSSYIQRFYDAMFKSTHDDDLYLSDISDDDMEEEEELHKQPWIPSLCLTMQDKKELVKNKMLSDKHMYAAQKLLKAQYPGVKGLQDTCLSQTRFARAPGEGLQIHHTRGNHWVLSYTEGNGRVAVYDTLYDEITGDLYRHLQDIYGTDGRARISYTLPDNQKQRGSRDCGLFVIALAIELCENRNPSTLRFDQKRMREHLLRCFDEGSLEPFPLME